MKKKSTRKKKGSGQNVVVKMLTYDYGTECATNLETIDFQLISLLPKFAILEDKIENVNVETVSNVDDDDDTLLDEDCLSDTELNDIDSVSDMGGSVQLPSVDNSDSEDESDADEVAAVPVKLLACIGEDTDCDITKE